MLDAGGNSFLRIGSCVAFAPYDNAEIAVIIVVDEPTSANKYGSMTAAPYISAYLSSVLPYLGISKAKSAGDVAVGSYAGTDVKKAAAAIGALGLAVETVGEGKTVVAQAPVPGTVLEKGVGKVILYTESELLYSAVPAVRGKTPGEAMLLLTNAGFNVRITGANAHGSVAAEATVLEQSLPPGTKAERGTLITIQIYHKNDTD